jgi:hypothetical protein
MVRYNSIQQLCCDFRKRLFLFVPGTWQGTEPGNGAPVGVLVLRIPATGRMMCN